MFSRLPWIVAAAAAAKSLQSCPTLCDPIDGSQPGSPIPGILQARTLEWVAIAFSNAWKWKVKSLSRVRPRSPIPIWLSAGKIQEPKCWIQKNYGAHYIGLRSLLYCPVGQDGLARGRQARAEARVEIMRNHIAAPHLLILAISAWLIRQSLWVSLTFSRDACLSHMVTSGLNTPLLSVWLGLFSHISILYLYLYFDVQSF